ncbi:tRNA threonylcarbamoyladenosine dehydratase [Pusillimonas sp. SM2304]|uniref:tRNA threonylcarbamoyladenosine dehydratase n=1 Tax=Pusillimonas sp. SM2304 TaxID=3073241 RepID=UPI0028753CD0|nr:tRNA threonylcarbamoyladenosine dehydratase [Pusillimonas sp. SM2304]MDS1140692.1 tRNA threonylcarbamoyladenosine dehydratase [Pusillimonas sp. SM2304]
MSDASSFDLQRRFGGLERLYGPESLGRLSDAHVAVAGIGGVGSWCAEALARTGIGALSLIDLDHIAESNVNRQLHALSDTLGQAKVMAMAQRVHGINPSCRLGIIDDFVSPENVAELLAPDVRVLIDCTDQAQAKIAMILEARRRGIPIVVCGGAGGKTDPLSLRAGDLSAAVNDALLSKLRNTLRRQHRYPKASDQAGKVRKRLPKMGVRALWFDQPALLPAQWLQAAGGAAADGSPDRQELGQMAAHAPEAAALQGLSCAGYGSVVTVTAAMGMAAANEAVHHVLSGKFAG